MTAGIVTFHKHWGETSIPVQVGRQPVSLVAAWYSLDPFAVPGVHQPLEPVTAWTGPDMPLYHLRQIRELRQTGIDALAVVLPADPALRERTRTRLSALSSALHDEEAAIAAPAVDIPLLLPVIDLSAGHIDAHSVRGSQAVEATLDDFYRLVPPQVPRDGAGRRATAALSGAADRRPVPVGRRRSPARPTGRAPARRMGHTGRVDP